jgi:6-phosphofructokinase 1
VPIAFGNLALNLILSGSWGRLVSLRHGVYDSVPINVVTERKKVIDVQKYYDVERLRPKYETLLHQPLFIMTSDV